MSARLASRTHSRAAERFAGAACETPVVGSEEEQEFADRSSLGLRGSSVESVDVDLYQVLVGFSDRSVLTIECPADLASASGQLQPAVTVGIDGTVTVSDALLAVLGTWVVSGVGFKNGTLQLAFSSGVELRVPFDADHEAWQLTGSSGRTWLSVPGGGLATFPGESS